MHCWPKPVSIFQLRHLPCGLASVMLMSGEAVLDIGFNTSQIIVRVFVDVSNWVALPLIFTGSHCTVKAAAGWQDERERLLFNETAQAPAFVLLNIWPAVRRTAPAF